MSMARFNAWRVYPYGWWEEPSGSYVIFDRDYRPICRHRPNCDVELIASDTFIAFTGQHSLYNKHHPADDAPTRMKINGIVERLGIEPEIANRKRLFKKRRLPRWDRGATT